MRLSTWGKPRIINCAEDHPKHLALPRGCLEDLQHVFDDLHVEMDTRDERTVGETIDLKFHGDLRSGQNTAVQKLLAHDTGVLSATTAFGKTVVTAWMIAQRGVNTLVLVHRRQLLDQWIDRLSEFLGIPSKQIGRIGGGRRKLSGQVDVAMICARVAISAWKNGSYPQLLWITVPNSELPEGPDSLWSQSMDRLSEQPLFQSNRVSIGKREQGEAVTGWSNHLDGRELGPAPVHAECEPQ